MDETGSGLLLVLMMLKVRGRNASNYMKNRVVLRNGHSVED
jgi:hypothetical protein